MSIAVIIPFYQREAGILAPALRGIASQELPAGVQVSVIIVDDESPVPAEQEVSAVPMPEHVQLRIVTQPNGGPAAARNRGLDSVADDTDYLAFLDSDDVWEPFHLANALHALESGCDFYFADFYQLYQEVSAFERAGRIDPAAHPTIQPHEHLHRYSGNMQRQIITGNVIGTSTVVFRRAIAPALRFQEAFVNAGEDYLFWLDLARVTDRIAFSSRCECTYGRGVNIFSGAEWGTRAATDRSHYQIKYLKAFRQQFELGPEEAEAVRAGLARCRKEYAGSLLHRIRSGDFPGPGELLRHGRVDPQGLLGVPLELLRHLAQRLSGARSQ